MNSKGYKRFTDRLRYFREDNEVAEIIVANKELLKGEDSIFANITDVNHPILSKRQNNVNSRKLVVQHLRKTIYVAFVKDMYEEVTEYIRYILKEAAINGADPNRLVGEHNVNMKANEILSKSNKREIISTIMEQIFQQLENERSTITLISKIKNKLGLNIPQDSIDAALPYLEVRHVFVHSDGKPCEEFKRKYPEIKLDQSQRILLNSSFAKDAYQKIKKLILEIDNEMMTKNYFSATEQCKA